MELRKISSEDYYLLNDKKALKIFCPKTWCTKKPFSYRVAHRLDIF